tara:strand:- start:171 stop:776 length:606 start_codon:yes stop_codon:yes gene_type:complete
MVNKNFREEKKISLTKFESAIFLEEIYKTNVSKKYDDRVVKSIYFENSELKMFKNSEEGILPRKKIRIRTYPRSPDNNHYLEKKISSVEGRFKEIKLISKKENESYLNVGILDNMYGCLKPILNVNYLRSYYENHDLRITHDRDIKYSNYKNSFYKNETFDVFEIKSKINFNANFEFTNNFQIRRFSKYCNAIRLLNYYSG